ncbi:hypothetical protein CMV_019808 [Castanea mollissima]|uniref:Uncharacterized protein n=1 Tax=Castanea mollissima TaxID=60419 RepID=A0A8J4QZN4_9ROSI|nr:hypothetical protein CMV_019808 [Castanea mollissima]
MKVLSEIALQIIKKKEKKRAGTSDCRIANRARRLCSKKDKDTYDSASPNSWLKGGGGGILWLLKLHDFRQRFSNLDHGED